MVRPTFRGAHQGWHRDGQGRRALAAEIATATSENLARAAAVGVHHPLTWTRLEGVTMWCRPDLSRWSSLVRGRSLGPPSPNTALGAARARRDRLVRGLSRRLPGQGQRGRRNGSVTGRPRPSRLQTPHRLRLGRHPPPAGRPEAGQESEPAGSPLKYPCLFLSLLRAGLHGRSGDRHTPNWSRTTGIGSMTGALGPMRCARSRAAMTLDTYSDLFDDDLDSVGVRLDVAAMQE